MTITLGTEQVVLSSVRKKRLAAAVFRRFWSRMSSTVPSWSTTRHRYFRSPPLILMKTLSRCHLSPGRGCRRRRPLA